MTTKFDRSFEKTLKLRDRKEGKQIATRENSIDMFNAFMNDLPNPDPILKKLGMDIEVYDELSADSRVKACVKLRKSAVQGMEWDIVGEHNSEEELAFHKSYFENYNMMNILSEILDAPLYGYKPFEIIWAEVENKVVPVDIVGKPQNWFVYNNKNELELKTFGGSKPLPLNKFVVARNEPTYANPYGLGAYAACYWPVSFRKDGWGFYVMFLEKYGMPFMMASAEAGTSEKRCEEVQEMLVNMYQDACAVAPKDFEIQLVEAGAGKSGNSAHPVFLSKADMEITMAILSNNLTTNVEGGSFAAAETHKDELRDINESDARIAESTFNYVIDYAHQYNYTSPSPKIKLYSEEKIDLDRAERDLKIQSGNQNFKFKPIYYERNYNLQSDEFELTEGKENDNGQGGNAGNDG